MKNKTYKGLLAELGEYSKDNGIAVRADEKGKMVR
jgi:hypothetical protein